MKIGSLCTRRVVTIDEDGTLAQAARLMREHHVGALVVTARSAQGLRIGGLVTDRDLVVEVLARGLDPASARIGELASTEIASVAEDDDLTQAIATMQGSGVRRLLVTDADQRLSGIVSLDDLVQACAGQIAGLADVVRAGLAREADEMGPTPPLPPGLRVPAVGTAGWGPEA